MGKEDFDPIKGGREGSDTTLQVCYIFNTHGQKN